MLNRVFRRFAGQVGVRLCAASAFALLLTTSASAVIVRGTVRDALHRPIGNAPVQLVQNGQVSAITMSLSDGSYELRSADAGRFVLLSGSGPFAIFTTPSFYGAQLDQVTRDITLTLASANDSISVTATGLPTPLAQISAAIHLIPANDLLTREVVVAELRLQPGIQVVQTGQNGGSTSLFVRGANSTANKVLIDGAPANDVGGVFDFGLLATTAVRDLEIHRGPDSVLFGTDALGSVVTFNTPRGNATRPVLNYSGDAGNFHTWRNEGELSGAYRKFDYYTGVSRFDSSNAHAMDRFHVVTSAGNLGYAVSGPTQLRGTVRQSVSAKGLPNAQDFYGIVDAGKQADQQTFFTGVIENTYQSNWHNLVRYYGARKREQTQLFYPVGLAIKAFGYSTYYGNVVTIRGANGYSATGRAAIDYGTDPETAYPQSASAVSNRDGVQYQSDYRISPHVSTLFGFRYEDERGSYVNPAFLLSQKAERRNYDYNLQLQGDVKGRVFFTLGGAVQKNYLFGTEGTPRFGIAWYPVRPGVQWFHGTKLHFNFSKGVQEPDLRSQLGSLYTTLLANGAAATIQSSHVQPIGAQRARTYEGGVDQNIYRERAVLHVSYFHNQFGRQIEYVPSAALLAYFQIATPSGVYGAYLNSLDFKAQGVEAEAEWRTGPRLSLRGGYTYLDAVVEHSFSSDVVAPSFNPNLPGIAIGASSPLVGQRPFRRPPQTGYAVATYNYRKLSAAVKAAFVSSSDDSTYLVYADFTSENTLLLPNRNLDYGYKRVDASFVYSHSSKLGVFAQLNNLLSQRRMGPIGFPSLPFNFRTGIKVRLGPRQ